MMNYKTNQTNLIIVSFILVEIILVTLLNLKGFDNFLPLVIGLIFITFFLI